VSEPQYTAGAILRVNGRWSLTHLFRRAVPELVTKCGLTYDVSELYDGEEEVECFRREHPGEPSFLRCGECFPDGTGSVGRSILL
jgi:hypothetical protein